MLKKCIVCDVWPDDKLWRICQEALLLQCPLKRKETDQRKNLRTSANNKETVFFYENPQFLWLLLTGRLWNLFSISHTFTIENLKANLPENIAKGTKDPRIEFISQNLDYASTSKSQPNISISTKSKVKILTKPSFRILTKIQLPNQQETVSNTILSTDISNSNNLNKFWVSIFRLFISTV